ncbi:yfhM [Symbiodinium necroappetens]|uniref:YfhM protein n=1 Tax=Symbiodinium necroappetens TaxID=1628268 RepID=A0A812IYG5_9DINO|nr:yfhM [Symbiodinium necroappetens]
MFSRLTLASASVAAVSVWLAWSPSTSWQEQHFSDEPFSWPDSLRYLDKAGSQGITLKTIVAGPNPAESKGVVLFVHGFPETAASWKEYILHYAAAGYHVLAPDMRNVNNSMAESGTLCFDLLSDDLLSLVTSTGHDKAIVVGHDWGAVISWVFALRFPARTQALVVMAVPHPELYRSYNVVRLPFSVTHVWYFLFWGLTGPLARWKAAKDDFAWFISFAFGSSRPKTYSKEMIKRLKEVYARTYQSDTHCPLSTWYWMGNEWLLKSVLPPSVLGPGIINSLWTDGQTPSIVPTLQLFGSDDIYVSPGMAGWSADSMYVAHPSKRTVVYDASHWLLHEKTAEILQEMDAFIQSSP